MFFVLSPTYGDSASSNIEAPFLSSEEETEENYSTLIVSSSRTEVKSSANVPPYRFSSTLADPAIELELYTYFADIPELIEVAWCESSFRHYDRYGKVKRGFQNNSDIGVMQINAFYHEETARSLGLDIYTLQGNLDYARWLYQREGLVPWNHSRHCWANRI